MDLTILQRCCIVTDIYRYFRGAVLYCTVTNTCLEVPNVSGVGLLMLKHDGLCMMAGEDDGCMMADHAD